MEYLILVFKNGNFKKHIIENFSKTYLRGFFRSINVCDCTYLIYDFKLNKYGEGKIDKNGEVQNYEENKKTIRKVY